jgi:DNA primase
MQSSYTPSQNVRQAPNIPQNARRKDVSPELIEAVRECNAVEDVIGERVQLRRSGSQFVGRCPFHADRSPSFVVHPAKGVFHCHGCGKGGDVFQFIRFLHGCSFRASIDFLATRAGLRIEGFRPSTELTAKVAAQKAQRQEQSAFERFCNDRIEIVNRRYRALGRAANHAEDCLRAGESDPYIHDLAWDALKRFRDFEARIEREGLCDLDILKSEWEQREVA